MKKVKIMLLSLALIAVVGGALAFKAKITTGDYCIGDPYVDLQGVKYCSFNPGTGVVTTDCDFGATITTTPGTPIEVCISRTVNINQCGSAVKCPTPINDFAVE